MAEQWMTYDELALQLGISRNAARVLAQRRRWRREAGNDGRARVLVDLEGVRHLEERRADARAAHEPGTDASTVNALRAAVETLGEQMERQRVDHAAERERLLTELTEERRHARDLADRLDRLHRDHRAEGDRHRQEAQAWRRDLERSTEREADLKRRLEEERQQAAQQLAEVRCALERARRPWWRRWRREG